MRRSSDAIDKATITEVMREAGCPTEAVKAAEKAPKAARRGDRREGA